MNRVTEHTNRFVKAGFTLIRNHRHAIWRCPCGHAQIVTTGSRCGGRGDQNAQAQIARTLRACTPKGTA